MPERKNNTSYVNSPNDFEDLKILLKYKSSKIHFFNLK